MTPDEIDQVVELQADIRWRYLIASRRIREWEPAPPPEATYPLRGQTQGEEQ